MYEESSIQPLKRLLLAGTALALASGASAQNQQPATFSIDPTKTPEVLQVLDATGQWTPIGRIDHNLHVYQGMGAALDVSQVGMLPGGQDNSPLVSKLMTAIAAVPSKGGSRKVLFSAPPGVDQAAYFFGSGQFSISRPAQFSCDQGAAQGSGVWIIFDAGIDGFRQESSLTSADGGDSSWSDVAGCRITSLGLGSGMMVANGATSITNVVMPTFAGIGPTVWGPGDGVIVAFRLGAFANNYTGTQIAAIQPGAYIDSVAGATLNLHSGFSGIVPGTYFLSNVWTSCAAANNCFEIDRLPANLAYPVTTTAGQPNVQITGGPNVWPEPGDPVWGDFAPLGAVVNRVSGPITGSAIALSGAIKTSTVGTSGAGGNGYAIGDTGLITTSTDDAIYVVDAVNANGAVTAFHLTYAGSGYVAGNNQATAITTGFGDGTFTINVTLISPGGGAGYAAGDTGNILTTSGDAAYVVDSVGGTGNVATFHLTSPGTNYLFGNFQATSTSGAGTGFEVNVTRTARSAAVVGQFFTVTGVNNNAVALNALVSHAGGSGQYWKIPSAGSQVVAASYHNNYVSNWPVAYRMICSPGNFPAANCTGGEHREGNVLGNLIGDWIAGSNTGGHNTYDILFGKNYWFDMLELGSIGSGHFADSYNSNENGTTAWSVAGNCGALSQASFYANYGSFLAAEPATPTTPVIVSPINRPYCMAIGGGMVAPGGASGTSLPLWYSTNSNTPSDVPLMGNGIIKGQWSFNQLKPTIVTNVSGTAGDTKLTFSGTVPNWVYSGNGIFDLSVASAVAASTKINGFIGTTQVTLSKPLVGNITSGDQVAIGINAPTPTAPCITLQGGTNVVGNMRFDKFCGTGASAGWTLLYNGTRNAWTFTPTQLLGNPAMVFATADSFDYLATQTNGTMIFDGIEIGNSARVIGTPAYVDSGTVTPTPTMTPRTAQASWAIGDLTIPLDSCTGVTAGLVVVDTTIVAIPNKVVGMVFSCGTVNSVPNTLTLKGKGAYVASAGAGDALHLVSRKVGDTKINTAVQPGGAGLWIDDAIDGSAYTPAGRTAYDAAGLQWSLGSYGIQAPVAIAALLACPGTPPTGAPAGTFAVVNNAVASPTYGAPVGTTTGPNTWGVQCGSPTGGGAVVWTYH